MRNTGNGAATSRTLRWSKTSRSAASKEAERRGGNGCGDAVRLQQRGFFEGCDVRRRGTRRSTTAASAGCGDRQQETRRTPGSAAGCNKPATPTRRKPPRWCKTTRAEQESERGSSGPRPDGNVGSEWTRWSMSMEGWYGGRTRERAVRRIPGEETGESRSARERCSEGEPKARGYDGRLTPYVAERAEDLEGPPGNGQGRGGNGEGQRPVTPEPRGSSEPWKRGADPTSLKAR